LFIGIEIYHFVLFLVFSKDKDLLLQKLLIIIVIGTVMIIDTFVISVLMFFIYLLKRI